MNNSSKTMPLVSIVLPTFNRAHLLAHSIRSVLDQIYRNLELILVDDHSSDDTEKVVRTFNDERIRYVRNQTNLKLPRSLNKGFSIAQGDLLTWTSDDNLYTDNAIQTMVEHIQTNNCDFVFTDYYHFSDLDLDTGRLQNFYHVKLPDILHLEKANQVGGCFLYSRNVYKEIGEYDPELFLVEDYDYFIRISKSFRMCHIDEPLYFFRRHDQSLYCSRFCEVKASDLLVRYKNRILDRKEFQDALVGLMLANIDVFRNPLVRSSFLMVKNTSYRMTKLYKKALSLYLCGCFGKKVSYILDGYDLSRTTFKEGTDALAELMQRTVKLDYKQ